MTPADRLLEDIGRALKRWRGTRNEVDRARVTDLIEQFGATVGTAPRGEER